MQTFPKSALEKAGGMAYFPRLLDKIRLHAQGKLPPAYHSDLGKGADGWCAQFLRVDYDELKQRVLAGGMDGEILQWCFEHGRQLDANDLNIWNGYITKVGWRDAASARLEQVKAETGLAHRTDLVTMADFFEVNEGREP